MRDVSLRSYTNRWAKEFQLSHDEAYGRLRALSDAGVLESGGPKGTGKSKPATPSNWVMLMLALMGSDTKVGAGTRAPELAQLPDVTHTVDEHTGAPGTNRLPAPEHRRKPLTNGQQHAQLHDVLVRAITDARYQGVVADLEVSRWRPQAWLRLREPSGNRQTEMVFATRPLTDVVADNTDRKSVV